MSTELFDLPDLPAGSLPLAQVAVGVPGVNGGSPTPYKMGVGAVFQQAIPAETWTVNHNLHRYPQVTVVDTTGRVLDADVTHVSIDQLTISGFVAFAGTAYLA